MICSPWHDTNNISVPPDEHVNVVFFWRVTFWLSAVEGAFFSRVLEHIRNHSIVHVFDESENTSISLPKSISAQWCTEEWKKAFLLPLLIPISFSFPSHSPFSSSFTLCCMNEIFHGKWFGNNFQFFLLLPRCFLISNSPSREDLFSGRLFSFHFFCGWWLSRKTSAPKKYEKVFISSRPIQMWVCVEGVVDGLIAPLRIAALLSKVSIIIQEPGLHLPTIYLITITADTKDCF